MVRATSEQMASGTMNQPSLVKNVVIVSSGDARNKKA